MVPSRDGKTCLECGRPTPSRPNARYCSRACQQKAYRTRHTYGGASELAHLRDRVAALEAELAKRDTTIEALRAKLARAHNTAEPNPPSRDAALHRTLRPTPAAPAREGAAPPAPPAHSVRPEVLEQGADRWTVTLGEIPAGTVTRRARPTGGMEWSAHTAGGREAWAGGPPRSLEDATRMLTSDLRSYLTVRYEHHHAKAALGRPRKDGSRLISMGSAQIGEARPAPGRGWHAHVPASFTGTSGLLRNQAEHVLAFPDARAAAQAAADYRLAIAEAFWCGETPRHDYPVLPQETIT